ncbi:MAG TPA: lipocalin-like domain-containing protein, partial [Terriglobales bacterium]
MKALLTLPLLAALSLAQGPTVSQLVGTWQLVSIEDTMKDGSVGPPADLGPHSKGFLMYEPDGHMCATLVNSDRPRWKDSAKATDAEKIAYYDTFIAYCGTYKLDSRASTVTHYPSVAWTPAYLGSTQPRPFKLEGNRLIITVTEGMANLGIQKRVLVWE